jgi:peptidoglycan/LPS O-acetylase OafA/YrhL
LSTVASDKPIGRVAILDGWRAASILSVLAGHWFPLGPGSWQLNASFATSGMALFFCLSGFLITQLLLRDQRVGAFLIRRLARIVPLAWAGMLALALIPANWPYLLENLGFIANLPPIHLLQGGNHLWSLCVEVQFYAVVALIVLVAGRRGLYALPLLALVVTGLRIMAGESHSIVTWHRVDEILAGATLALVANVHRPGETTLRLPSWTPLALWLLLLASAHPDLPTLQYARPYIAALTIGTSLYVAPEWFRRIWTGTGARYVAEISYALYVVHGILSITWLGAEDGTKVERYVRRPLLVLATWAVAHVSTFYYEQRFIALGKKLTSRPAAKASIEPVGSAERTMI